MSAHILLNLLKYLGEKIRCEAMPSILSFFHKEFNTFNNSRFYLSYDAFNSQMSHQNVKISPLENATFYGRQHITLRNASR